jgi:hypothetical protein
MKVTKRSLIILGLFVICSCNSAPQLRVRPNCAHLRDGEKCGLSGLGHLVYAVNESTDRRVRVSVREYWSGGGQTGHTDSTHELDASREKQVGCTLGGAPPYYHSTYQIIGCEVL